MNKFNWKFLTKNDYQTILDWWSDWGWPEPPTLDTLPSNAFLVYDASTLTPVYVGFLYETGTSLGWVEYIVRNKKADTSICHGGLEYLIETISTVAKTRGIEKLFTSTLNQSFVQSLKKTGFLVGDTGMTQLIKIL